MGLLDEFGAWLDQKKRNLAANVQEPGLLWTRMNEDARQYQQDWRQDMADEKSVMPEIRQQGQKFATDKALELGGLLGAIRVFHGSPHKFDKFDFSKIGTGEGAQAYGHGGYFAESPKVAREYAEKLTKDANWRAADIVDADSAGYFIKTKDGKKYFDSQKEALEFAQQQRENLYEANLRWPDAAREAADPLGPQHFLDWDKPLPEQPAAVRKMLEKIGVKQPDKELIDEAAAQVLDAAKRNDSAALGQAQRDWTLLAYPRKGQEIYREFPTDARASQVMRDAGIPGIRYLDGGSRNAGQGTSNYVVFDSELTEILKRNGIPIGGLMSGLK